ncbi:MAG: acetyl-CoA carboxylase biotin carboxyl carrier protein subunit, partial [Planctomycetaceae bacterium]
MADQEKTVGDSFDLDRLKQLIRLMEKHDLTEVKLQGGDQKWVLRRGAAASACAIPGHWGPPPIPYPSAPPPLFAGGATLPEGARMDSPAAEEAAVVIKSPTVGTFYAAPQPGDPPFVNVGDRVAPETIVCIFEAMKVFYQIPA